MQHIYVYVYVKCVYGSKYINQHIYIYINIINIYLSIYIIIYIYIRVRIYIQCAPHVIFHNVIISNQEHEKHRKANPLSGLNGPACKKEAKGTFPVTSVDGAMSANEYVMLPCTPQKEWFCQKNLLQNFLHQEFFSGELCEIPGNFRAGSPQKSVFSPLDFHWIWRVKNSFLEAGWFSHGLVGRSEKRFQLKKCPPKVHHVPPRVFSLAMRAARFFPSPASPEAAGDTAGPSWRRSLWPHIKNGFN